MAFSICVREEYEEREATAEAYRESRDDDAPLADRLIDALEADHAEGGDDETSEEDGEGEYDRRAE